ncbi:MAG: response regulator [Planctomycetes bacterium]|nr:response regulator [Planctomycetota bacterium]
MSATILVVEDDRNQRLLYQTELEAEGYDVILACDGKEAVQKAEEQPFDIIVMDIAMPNMDGIEALSKILAKNNRIPVILNTAYASYKDNFMTWSADAYVIKSSDMRELKGKICEILSARTQGPEDQPESNEKSEGKEK